MMSAVTTSVARQLGSLFAGGSTAGLSDRQLIERFVAGRDSPAAEAAFAALVARHGPMVLGVCRHILGDRHRAEDAFQAVFLVLARRAHSVRDPDLLGNWLYGVALRTARNARKRLARRRRSEKGRAMQPPEACSARPTEQAAIDRERAEALHAEVDRLPGSFRLAVVLCYFEGLSLSEAAERLRCPAGTVHSRLDRAREKLRRGLLRRGFALSTTAIAAMLAPRSASASVPPLLCDSTTRAAIAFAAHHAASGALTASATAMAQEVLRMMLLHKLKVAALSLCLLAAVATGAGLLSRSLAGAEEPGRPAAAQAPTRAAEQPRPQAALDLATAGRMTVAGRVLRPDGRPAAGVPVDIIAAPRIPKAVIEVDREAYAVLGQGSTDDDGRFRIEAMRASSARFYDAYALAGAAGPGSAFGCVRFSLDAEQPAAEIHLQPEQLIRGKLVDVNGQPAAGVEVGLMGAYSESSPLAPGRFEIPRELLDRSTPGAPPGLRAWPRTVTTDAQGRFTFAGVGGELLVALAVRHPQFAHQRFEFPAKDRDAAKEVSLALHPAKIIEGRVLADDTGRPIPGAVISVWASFGRATPMWMTNFRADDQGRFRVNPYAGDLFLSRIFPPEGQPYLPQEAEIAWDKGAVKKEVEFRLPRGVLIRGKVTEQGTGRPVAGASVQFFPAKQSRHDISGRGAVVAAKDNGSFQLAVPPGKGYLMVVGPTLDYILREIGGGQLSGGNRPGGQRFYAHDIVAYEVKAGEGPRELNATLVPAKALRGRVVGPTGETVQDAVILSRQQIRPRDLSWEPFYFIHAHDSRFELAGFDPEKATPVYFLDTDHGWGARVELSGKQAGEDLTIRLQPCGQARARFVGPDGQPVARLTVGIYFQILMTPGSSTMGYLDRGESLAAEGTQLSNFDPKNHPGGLATDAEGRVTLPALIPGALYRISDWSTVNVQGKGYQLRKEFTVKPGETLDLGDILVEEPELGR
jgi:RNA polymerase sigma factor (sigma-70 family)